MEKMSMSLYDFRKLIDTIVETNGGLRGYKRIVSPMKIATDIYYCANGREVAITANNSGFCTATVI